MARNTDPEQRIDQLERQLARQAKEIDQLRRELRGLGIEVPELNPAHRTKLSPQARLERLRLAAARARASKPVGTGKGSVSDRRTAARLRSEAAQLLAEADEAADG